MARKGKGGKKPTDDKKKVGESEPAAAPAASAEDADKSADQNVQDARVDEARLLQRRRKVAEQLL